MHVHDLPRSTQARQFPIYLGISPCASAFWNRAPFLPRTLALGIANMAATPEYCRRGLLVLDTPTSPRIAPPECATASEIIVVHAGTTLSAATDYGWLIGMSFERGDGQHPSIRVLEYNPNVSSIDHEESHSVSKV